MAAAREVLWREAIRCRGVCHLRQQRSGRNPTVAEQDKTLYKGKLQALFGQSRSNASPKPVLYESRLRFILVDDKVSSGFDRLGVHIFNKLLWLQFKHPIQQRFAIGTDDSNPRR